MASFLNPSAVALCLCCIKQSKGEFSPRRQPPPPLPATVPTMTGTRGLQSGTATSARARPDGAPRESDQQQMDLSVLRFTLGIPGLDEAYLPRYISLAFGSLLLLNHFVSGAGSPTPAQLTSEAVGTCLAVLSYTLPYLGKFLKGAKQVDRSFLPEGNRQIFILSEIASVQLKEDLAWASFVLLRNTNTISVLISVQEAICIRGYWNAPEGFSKAEIIEWFWNQIKELGLPNLNDALYFPQSTDQLWGILPKGTSSLLLQPIEGASDPGIDKKGEPNGFVLLVSSANYAYSDKDKAWIGSVADKFKVFLP